MKIPEAEQKKVIQEIFTPKCCKTCVNAELSAMSAICNTCNKANLDKYRAINANNSQDS